MEPARRSRVRDLLELIGMFSIAASLVFVGMQLRQDRLIARAELFHARIANTSENFRTFVGNQDVAAITTKLESGQPLEPAEQRAMHWAMVLGNLAYLDQFYQFELGLMDAETWAFTRENLKRDLRRPGFADAVFDASPEYHALIERLVDEIEPENAGADPETTL